MAAVPFIFGPAISPPDFQRLKAHMALDFCKWDLQVGDATTLFPQPLLMRVTPWQNLCSLAEALAAELAAAEEELLRHPELFSALGLPPRLLSAFQRGHSHVCPSAVRVLRFDFHFTERGWHISEVNSDVPGGYTEASCFTALMSQHISRSRPAGNPATAWAHSICARLRERSCVALLSAPGFTEDQQVTAFLAGQLHAANIQTCLVHHPCQITWDSGIASTVVCGKRIVLDAIVRFYQGEWLSSLPSKSNWESLLFAGTTLVTNPAQAILTESKRFPLIWDRLSTSMKTWGALMPQSRDPRECDWKNDDSWVLKATYSNTGDDVYIREALSHEAWMKVCRTVTKHPDLWVAQRRFYCMPVSSDLGALYPCVGVYTIDGRCAGAYVRASSKSVTDFEALDVALLIMEDDDAH